MVAVVAVDKRDDGGRRFALRDERLHHRQPSKTGGSITPLLFADNRGSGLSGHAGGGIGVVVDHDVCPATAHFIVGDDRAPA